MHANIATAEGENIVESAGKGKVATDADNEIDKGVENKIYKRKPFTKKLKKRRYIVEDCKCRIKYNK